jgi:hypothetical protein
MSRLRAGRWKREPEAWLLAGFVLWSLLPIPLLLPLHGTFTGTYGLQVADQYQHMAFIRDAGEHLLASSRFDLAPDPHLFLHPLFVVSGLVWRAGGSIQLAFLVWLPVAIAVLFAGFALYVRRVLGGARGARLAALFLALFFFTPAAPLADWLSAGDGKFRFGTKLMGLEMFPGGYVWGGFAATISVGLMPLFLLGAERVLEPGRRAAGRSRRWYLGWTCLAGLLCAWLHPWQGMVLVVIVAGLFAWSRFDRSYLVLALPTAATLGPLAYYWALGHTHSAWQYVSRANDYDHFGYWLIASLAPFALAATGYFRAPGDDLQERVLRLWPLAAFAVFFGLQKSWFFHAFAATSLPLAILAVRGWRDLRLWRPLGVAAIAAVTIPGMVFMASQVHKARPERLLDDGEAQALRYLDSLPRPGGVLAPLETGQAVPAYAGRRAWVANYYWTPDYGRRRDLAAALFSGRLAPAQARALVREAGAPLLLSSCRRNADLSVPLRGMVERTRRFGCATVYELRPSRL